MSQESGFLGPNGAGKERRASLVIKETAELLHGLHAEADRSRALMEELEGLLLASQAASGEAPTDSILCSAGCDTVATANFVAVQPLWESATEVDVQRPRNEVPRQPLSRGNLVRHRASASAFEGDGQQSPEEVSPRPVSVGVASKRRSSVITFDGSTLFGNGGVSGGNGQALLVSPGGDSAMPSGRAHSFTRTRTTMRGVPWLEGPASTANSIRRRSLIDMAGVHPPAPLGASTGAGSPPAMTAAQSRASATDELELSGRVPSQSWRTPSALLGAPFPGAAWPGASGNAASAFQMQVRPTEDGAEASQGDQPGPCSLDGAQAAAGARGASAGSKQTGRPASRARGGRFIKILKGIFNTDDQGFSRIAPAQTPAGHVSPSFGQPLSPTGSGGLPCAGPYAATAGRGAPSPVPEVQRCAGGDNFTVSQRAGSLTAASGGLPLVPLQPRRFSSFQVARAAVSAGQSPGPAAQNASRLAASASGPLVSPSVMSTATARSLSMANSLVGGRTPQEAAPSSPDQTPATECNAAGELDNRGGNRRSLTCVLPQI